MSLGKSSIALALKDRRQPTVEWYLAQNEHRTSRGGKLDFNRHRYQVSILKDKAQILVVRKSTQCGISECEIVHAIACVDQGRNVFWVFPDERLRNSFAKDRIDPAINASEYYTARAVAANKRLRHGRDASDEVALKQIGNGSIAMVGGNSAAAFKSFSADDAIVDEVDQCKQSNLANVPDRLAHSDFRTIWWIGNPTISGFGIDKRYADSDQKVWHVRCPSCNDYQPLDWFVNVVREVEEGCFELRGDGVVCRKCEAPLDRLGPGEWVAKHPGREVSGYHISQIFSGSVPVIEMWQSFQKGLANETEKQRFHNSVLGMPHTSEGAQLTHAVLDKCVGDHPMVSTGEECFMGVDVGSVLNTVIFDGKGRVLWIGLKRQFEELDNLMSQYGVILAVVDALPETRKAREFASRHPSQVLLCTFVKSTRVPDFKADYGAQTVSADRTQTLDDSHAAILQGRSPLPRQAASIEDFYAQMCAPVRVFDEARQVFRWEEGSQADHYRHAFNYGWLAKSILERTGQPKVTWL